MDYPRERSEAISIMFDQQNVQQDSYEDNYYCALGQFKYGGFVACATNNYELP
jgi:hypothetical protein